ncbi:MAG: helix-turn-helix transcriptional regulator, partial [Muribaculaceae bacterium]|nr:helix-turn-helix transcriptional regulator [Muribaculaceae bacterium]
HLPVSQKRNYYLSAQLKMLATDGECLDVLHRMYYLYADDAMTVTHAICIYQLSVHSQAAKCEIVNSVTGMREAVVSDLGIKILSRRECQVLALIQQGRTSAEIASDLCISKHTVSRHRQEIIAKLQVRNTIEAIKVAKSLNILT